jgi:hypothetical protein
MNGRDTVQSSINGPAWHGAGEWPFDIWLRRSLADAHNQALAEDLPDEWLALLEAPPRARGSR